VGCSACADIMDGVDGVEDGSCTDCDGANPADCAAATCDMGYHTFVAGVGCSECTAVGNEESGATYTCTSADDSDVSGCADGFWEDETGTADVCTECTAVHNAETNATYICTAANDSDVSGCADGFGEDETGTADICTAPCDSSEAPLNGAVGTCTSTLFYGTCQPECNTGYTVSGTTSCEDGTLTAATCAESCSDERSSYMIKNNKYCESWHFLEHMCVKSSWKTAKFCQHSCHALGLGYEDEDCPMDSSCSNRPSRHMVEKQVTCESWPHLKYMCSKSHWVTKKFCQRSCFKIGLGYDGDVC